MRELILLLIIVIGAYYYLNKSYDYFKNFANVYLSKEETSEFLLKDDDMYVSSMTLPDLHARSAKTHTQYLQNIASSSIDFTESEKTLLDNSTEKADLYLKTLESPYINNDLMKKIIWKFAITTDKKYEEGFPHTRDDIIFIDSFLLAFSEDNLVKTLIHEKVHMYQRKYIELFQSILSKEGYILLKERKTIPLIRANPDLDKYIYKHPNGEIMMSIYNNSKPSSIMDTILQNGSMEHPFEEIAYNIRNIVNNTSKKSILSKK